MNDLESEILGFIIVAVIVIALGIFTKKKENEYNKMLEEIEDNNV